MQRGGSADRERTAADGRGAAGTRVSRTQQRCEQVGKSPRVLACVTGQSQELRPGDTGVTWTSGPHILGCLRTTESEFLGWTWNLPFQQDPEDSEAGSLPLTP